MVCHGPHGADKVWRESRLRRAAGHCSPKLPLILLRAPLKMRIDILQTGSRMVAVFSALRQSVPADIASRNLQRGHHREPHKDN